MLGLAAEGRLPPYPARTAPLLEHDFGQCGHQPTEHHMKLAKILYKRTLEFLLRLILKIQASEPESSHLNLCSQQQNLLPRLLHFKVQSSHLNVCHYQPDMHKRLFHFSLQSSGSNMWYYQQDLHQKPEAAALQPSKFSVESLLLPPKFAANA